MEKAMELIAETSLDTIGSTSTRTLYLARVKTLIVTVLHASDALSVRRQRRPRVAVDTQKIMCHLPLFRLDIPFSEMQLVRLK